MSSRKSFSRLTWWVSPRKVPVVWEMPPGPGANRSVSPRFRKQRKAVVSANDKKMPNGILEEQGTRGPGAGGAVGVAFFLTSPGAVVCLLFFKC